MKVSTILQKIAPGFLGAFFLALGLSGCKDKDKAGDWSGNSSPAEAPAPAVPKPAPAPVAAAPAPVAIQPPVTEEEPLEEGSVRFIEYNVENWLTMDRTVKGKKVAGAPKPETERHAVAEAIASAKPDILGISEIGTEEDVKDLQKHLADAGLSLPHYHMNRGSDPTRSLVLLSRFPIGDTVTRDNLKYRSKGQDMGMQRGILDAKIDTPAGPFRFIGVHLKSKREIDDGDEEEMRLNEAHLLRAELDSIIDADPAARLVVYGDFNDTRQSPAIRAVHGAGKNPKSLMMIALKDSRGQFWTHYWDYQDVYSRIDYVFVTPTLKKAVDWDRCKIIDNEAVGLASDHRPLLVILKK